MDIKPVKTKADYRAALAEIERLFDAKRGTPEGDRLDVLATLRDAITPLVAEDIAQAILYAVTQPPRVNVNEIFIRPTEQE
jgi:HTH-type transcriptional regulator/antitoxin HigA